MKNISAFTETTGQYAPGYVNVAEDENGQVVLSVRTAGAQNVSFVRMNRHELSQLAKPCVIVEIEDNVEPETEATPAPTGKKAK